MRHGEKPPEGLGQLDCQGLNRALALPQILKRKFGIPDYIFAPDPRQQVLDHENLYYYIRPLATIEPTAIRLGKPVNTRFGYKQIAGLQTELTDSHYYNALIFVAWEHNLLVQLARNLVESAGGNPSVVPDWSGTDFDSLYVCNVMKLVKASADGVALTPIPPDAERDRALQRSRAILDVSYAGSPLIGERLGEGICRPEGPAPGERYPDRTSLTGPAITCSSLESFQRI